MEDKTVHIAHLNQDSEVEVSVKVKAKAPPETEEPPADCQEDLVADALGKPWKVLYEIGHKIIGPKR
jgi:hypothetical protein